MKRLRFFTSFLVLLWVYPAHSQPEAVKAYEESLTMKTYQMKPDEPNPIYRDFRLPGLKVSRGSRSTYPYTWQDQFTNNSKDVDYQAVILENEYIKVIILPELRGRIHAAIDKRNGWDFLYYNHVIKPADISVRQGWIAGGLEPNHPGGHGYTQFDRISYEIIAEADGSQTVVIAEIEPVRMMKWEYEITLRPGHLYLETKGRLMSTHPYPIQFCSSQNAAMHATPEMEVILPEGSYVPGHGKKTMEAWPVIDGIDYSWFKNTNRAFSAFADGRGLTEEFYGCYSHDDSIDAGTVIVADHRTVPGKKYFSWGDFPQGRTWDWLLSDTDGPYIELQSQAYWDNLGYGYAWLNPLEVKDFTVYWIPVMQTGGFVKASRDITLNIKEASNGQLNLFIQAHREIPEAQIVVKLTENSIFEQAVSLSPESINTQEFNLPDGSQLEDLRFQVIEKNKTLISYQKFKQFPEPPAQPFKEKPLQDMSLDELYQKGWSFYHDPWQPAARQCFEEMLRRNPHESRANRSLGVFALHHGQYGEAIRYLKTAERYDPLNEGYASNYYLGMAYLNQLQIDSARYHLTIASRHKDYYPQAMYYLSQCEFKAGNSQKAIDLLEEIVAQEHVHPMMLNLLAIYYRHAGNKQKAQATLNKAQQGDRLNFMALTEHFFLTDGKNKDEIHQQFDRRDETFVGSQLYIESALLYMQLGLWQDATQILQLAVDYYKTPYPMLEYYLAYCHAQQGDEETAKNHYRSAAKRNSRYVFPYRNACIPVLQNALTYMPNDANSLMYMGNLLYFLRQHEEAITYWEKSIKQNGKNPVACRSLAHAYWWTRQDTNRVVLMLQKANNLAPEDTRCIMELDHMYDVTQQTDKRLQLLENNKAVQGNDELILILATLYLRLERYEEAAQLMDNNQFYATEFIAQRHARYSLAHIGYGEKLLAAGKADEAIAEYNKCFEYPRNLSEDEQAYPVYTREYYLLGKAYQNKGNQQAAKDYFKKAMLSACNAVSEAQYYKALAFREMKQAEKANTLLYQLATNARHARQKDDITPELAAYLTALANKGLGNTAEYQKHLNKAQTLDPDIAVKVHIKSRRLQQTHI